ncbi:MAG: hypothetical protein GX640_04130 [Fibrobacter sp.]|nr:hypothetical protein [Fibrobacter sp.]
MRKNILHAIAFSISFLLSNCNNTTIDPEPLLPQNELVALWHGVLDTVSEEGKEYFWCEDSTKERGGFWNLWISDLFLNDNYCSFNGFNRYKISGDTVWLFWTGGSGRDPNGVVVYHSSPDTAVTLYHRSNDTLYFEKIDHPKYRYFPNYIFFREVEQIDYDQYTN